VDAAMAIVLALFFGGGMVLHRVILAGPYPSKGGLAEYLFGNASHLTVEDIVSSIVVAGATFLLAAIAFKELKLSCFDPEYAATLGFSSRLLSMLLNAVVVLSIVIGLKAVGLVLMVALAIAPPIAARQWTTRVGSMLLLSGLIGAVSAVIGSWLAVSIGRVPTGPMIVLVVTVFAFVSILFAPKRSILLVALARHRHRKEVTA
jgi:ABC-3 protein